MTVRWVALEPGAKVIGLRYGYSPEKYQSFDFATAEEAAEFAAGDSFIEIPTLRNPGGAIISFEGRIIADPAEMMAVGTAVERVWYTVPPDETPYDDFTAARTPRAQMPNPPSYVLEQLRLREPDGRVVEQTGRILNLDPTWSPVSSRYANAYPQDGRRGPAR
jgi:hypothetical protein